MAAICSACGVRLELARRLTGKSLCETHEAAEEARQEADERARADARAEYTALSTRVGEDEAIVGHLTTLAVAAGFTPMQRQEMDRQALRTLMAQSVDDELLTEEEERRLYTVAQRLDLPPSAYHDVMRTFGNRLLIAQLAAGRLPTIPNPAIILKRGEVAHLQVEADLMKEVVHRETRGSHSGFSIPIAKGVRYRTGGYRGRSVVVGTSLEVADSGILCVTSQRAVFKGIRQAVECVLSKLVGVNVFDDGIQFHVSNRKTATLLRSDDGHLVGAAVNAAVQRL